MTGRKIHIVSPNLFDLSIKRNVFDGEIWAIAGFLDKRGHTVQVHDGYYSKTAPLGEILRRVDNSDPITILIHLWKVEAFGEELLGTLRTLEQIKRESSRAVSVIGFGYLAKQVSGMANSSTNSALDAVISANGVHYMTGLDPEIESIASDTHAYLTGSDTDFPLTDILTEYGHDLLTETSVVSLHASRGCRSRCTFCCYNSDLNPGWYGRPMATVAEEVAQIIRNSPARNIAFFDNDFGGSEVELTERAKDMLFHFERLGIAGEPSISLNIRSECLNAENVAILAKAGVKTMLVGLESFNPQTRARIFGKKLDLDHLHSALRHCKAHGVTILLSYILWHPWQTIEGLREEVSAIQEVGRHYVPQFLTRSALQVVPGTPIDKRLVREGLIGAQDGEERSFLFACENVGRLHATLSNWLKAKMADLDLSGSKQDQVRQISLLKLEELELYKTVLCEAEPTSLLEAQG